jgi:hypothetical protein
LSSSAVRVLLEVFIVVICSVNSQQSVKPKHCAWFSKCTGTNQLAIALCPTCVHL